MTSLTDTLPPAAAKLQRLADAARDADDLRETTLALLNASEEKQRNQTSQLARATETAAARHENAETIAGIESAMAATAREIQRRQEQLAQRDAIAVVTSATFHNCANLVSELPEHQFAKAVAWP